MDPPATLGQRTGCRQADAGIAAGYQERTPGQIAVHIRPLRFRVFYRCSEPRVRVDCQNEASREPQPPPWFFFSLPKILLT